MDYIWHEHIWHELRAAGVLVIAFTMKNTYDVNTLQAPIAKA